MYQQGHLQTIEISTDLSITVINSKVQLNNFNFQGGPCSDTVRGLLYYNSFLIADHKEAWVLETVRKFWAAQKITSKTFSSSMRPRGHDEGSYGAKQQSISCKQSFD